MRGGHQQLGLALDAGLLESAGTSRARILGIRPAESSAFHSRPYDAERVAHNPFLDVRPKEPWAGVLCRLQWPLLHIQGMRHQRLSISQGLPAGGHSPRIPGSTQSPAPQACHFSHSTCYHFMCHLTR